MQKQLSSCSASVWRGSKQNHGVENAHHFVSEDAIAMLRPVVDQPVEPLHTTAYSHVIHCCWPDGTHSHMIQRWHLAYSHNSVTARSLCEWSR